MTRRLAAISLAFAAFTLSACASSDPYDEFSDALNNGAACAELFEIRNGWDSGSPDANKANEALREIGCYSASSERTA